jgi:NAD(P)-dependent dehydrogenase (short-subunit alcohol dehydrogenase family)
MCEGANMNDKTVIVTGPTSGIGQQVATELARLGATWRPAIKCPGAHRERCLDICG